MRYLKKNTYFSFISINMAIKKLSKASPLSTESYKTAIKHFYISSKVAIAEITDLYDFVYPSITALWNLRYEVTGYLHVRGDEVTRDELNKKLVNHEKFNHPNLYRSCVEFSWDKQKEDFAKIILINLFAYHEAWIENIPTEIGHNTKGAIKALQFPSYPGKAGIIEMLTTLTATPSTAISNAFYPAYIRNKRHNLTQLNNLLICYRYFKECRNAIIHSGGIVDQKLVTIEQNIHYCPLLTSNKKLNLFSNLCCLEINSKSPLKTFVPLLMSFFRS